MYKDMKIKAHQGTHKQQQHVQEMEPLLQLTDSCLWGELGAPVLILIITETDFCTQVHRKRQICRIKSSVNKNREGNPKRSLHETSMSIVRNNWLLDNL